MGPSPELYIPRLATKIKVSKGCHLVEGPSMAGSLRDTNWQRQREMAV